MNASLQDMTQGNLKKQILLFSLPLIFSNLLQTLFNMSDIAVVGQFAGPNALGAVGSTTTLVLLFTGFLIGIGSGVNVIVARYFGMRNRDALERTVHTAALLCLGIGVLLSVIGLLFSRGILELLHTKPELIDDATLYLRIYFLGMPALAVYNFGNAVFSAAGDTKRPLRYLSLAGVVNVVLNLIFVIVFELDVAGVAIASIISQYLSAVLILIALFRTKEDFGLRPSHLRINPYTARQILSLGVPAGVQNSLFQIANLFVQIGVNSFPATVVAGNSAASNSDGMVYDVMGAFYTACGTFMSQNFGAGKRDRVKKSYLISLCYSFGIGAILGGLLVLFGSTFLSLFTSDAAVIEAGLQRLTIMGCSYAFSCFMDGTIAASRGLGKSVVPTVIVIIGTCVFRVAWIYTVFAYFQTIPSLYLLYICSWIVTAIAEILYFRHAYRKQMALLD